MKPAAFRAFQTPEAAASWGCFQCCNALDAATVKDSGYPPGRGRYVLQCTECLSYTFFDLESKSNETRTQETAPDTKATSAA